MSNSESKALSDDENASISRDSIKQNKDLSGNEDSLKTMGATPLPLPEKPIQFINSNPVRKRKRNKILEKTSGNIECIKEKSGEKPKSSNTNMKTSLSMTSLPPDEKQESIEAVESRLKAERPYNSLKKNVDGNFGIGNKQRYSWGSGHSSSSLHSSATFGFGSGKDDLWAAIQTNYNYIMDTNLMDSCKEARGEIECTKSIIENSKDTEIFSDDTNRGVTMYSDLTELQKWLQTMEEKLKNAPTLSEATLLSIVELERHFSEHSILYHEIVSHVRAVSACIRTASEKKQNPHNSCHKEVSQEATNEPSHESTSNTLKISTGESLEGANSHDAFNNQSIESLDNLQSRYHHLYLKAFEVQLWLDGLLRKKSISGNPKSSDLSSDDEDNWLYSSMRTQAEKNVGFQKLSSKSNILDISSVKTSTANEQQNDLKECNEDTTIANESFVKKNVKAVLLRASNASCSSTSSNSSYSSNDFLTEATTIVTKPQFNDKLLLIQHQKPVVSHRKAKTEELSSPKMEIGSVSFPKNCTGSGDEIKILITDVKTHKEEEMLGESIKKLVLGAEHLVRDEVFKTPSKRLQKIIKLPTTVKKRETNAPGPMKKRIQDWLELHQNTLITGLDTKSNTQKGTDDCEASGEASETDSKSIDSDTSEGLTDSIATCMQTSTHSQEASTDGNVGAIETQKKTSIITCVTGQHQFKVQKRNQTCRKSERPWSVSCISQLSSESKNTSRNADCKLKAHSISESALNSIASVPKYLLGETMFAEKHSDLKTLLKRRKVRRKRIINIDWLLTDITDGSNRYIEQQKLDKFESDNDGQLIKPIFRVGSYTSSFMSCESRLGPLAALSNYMHNEEQQECTTGPEDHHSSFSETAWDNYQEKYNSENYSEGVDSDAARRLLEFGDDYRNFIDSQSDCCSSLSAANMESLSPPQIDVQHQNDTKIINEQFVNAVDHNRRRRVLDLEYERRRKDFPENSKSFNDSIASSTSHMLISNEGEQKATPTNRKLEFGNSRSVQSLRRTSESDTSMRRRKLDDRRRSSRNLEKNTKFLQASSSSNNSSDDEKELHSFFRQSNIRLNEIHSLKERQQLLQSDDYMEIINTCRDNIRCLEALICGPSRTVISSQCVNQTRDLLESWKIMYKWSDDMSKILLVQGEMHLLKQKLCQLGSEGYFDILNAETLQNAVTVTMANKLELENYHTDLLHCNESVNKIITQQKIMKFKVTHSQTHLLEEYSPQIDFDGDSLHDEAYNPITNFHDESKSYCSNKSSSKQSHTEKLPSEMLTNIPSTTIEEVKNEVGELYNLWNEANSRIDKQHKILDKASIMWQQFENGLLNFRHALGEDRGTLQNLEDALNKDENITVELTNKMKFLAHMISDGSEDNQNQITSMKQHLNSCEIFRIAKCTSSNGSLSDSGISDGGAISDGGLSGRERSLYALRKLAKQLESSLAPGSAVTKLIESRMESAEVELKTIQNTCRELIARTVSKHENNKKFESFEKSGNPEINKSSKQKKNYSNSNYKFDLGNKVLNSEVCTSCMSSNSAESSEPSTTENSIKLKKGDVKLQRKYTWWRVVKMAFPIQIGIFTIFGLLYLLQSTCCENKNTLFMSLTPQLNYRSGPPPI